MLGYRSYDTRDDSRNNWFVAITGGEGWHNNHHHDPTAATVQHRWREIDLNYYVIRLLQFVGLAAQVVPRDAELRKGAEGEMRESQAGPS